eukprot:UN02222
MSDFTIRVRKSMTNPLLGRRQMVVDVYHPERANVQKAEVKAALAQKLKVDDENKVFVFGFKVAFGGQKSTGFATVYNTMEDAYSVEPKHRLVRHQLIAGVSKASRKVRKDQKNKLKRLTGLQKVNGKRKRNRGDDE